MTIRGGVQRAGVELSIWGQLQEICKMTEILVGSGGNICEEKSLPRDVFRTGANASEISQEASSMDKMRWFHVTGGCHWLIEA